MKKITLFAIITLVFLCFSCDNEPYDGEIFIEDTTIEVPTTPTDPVDPEPTDPTDPGASLQLADYDYIKSFASTPGNEVTFVTDFVINSQNQFTAQNTSITLLGTTIDGVANVIRNPSSNIIELRSSVGGTIINRTTITYSLDKIVQIDYEDLQDAADSYSFTFIHSNEVITRTKEGTIFSTKFTFDTTTSKLIQRETLESGAVVKTETISYDNSGNLTSVVITGEDADTYTYSYDSNTNPLRNSLNDLYLFSILNDEYDDQYEHWQAVIYSNNNLITATTTQGSSNLNVEYDASNRIISRNGTIFTSVPIVSDDAVITIDEAFEYIN